ncbi:MAG: undecaprenyldiphospho-muramoylpentapeptide beta-N-acetylglucosaminyltransferase [Bacteroidota bacterium]
MSQRFIIAGGGTGGHIFPALAIAEALRSLAPESVFQFVGAKGKMEMEKVPQAGFEIEGLDIVGLDRNNPVKNLSLPIKLIRSFIQVRSIFKRFRPTAVIGVGGYSSYPVLRYAQAHHIPSFLHESNSFAGKSNQWLGKRADRIFTGMPSMEKFFPASKITFTGNPVRTAISESSIDRSAALRSFGLNSDKRTLLVIGGSLGARSINQAILKGCDRLVGSGLQLIWQTGQSGIQLPALSESVTPMVYRTPFITEIGVAYAAADIVVARAGAMSIAELQVVGKPVILVPYPLAAEDHQTANAMQLVNANAALMVRDADVQKNLIDQVMALAAEPDRCEQMRVQISKLGVKDADHRIATAILEMIKEY